MEAYIPKLLVAIPALPLLAAVVVAVLGKRVLRNKATGPWFLPWRAPAWQACC